MSPAENFEILTPPDEPTMQPDAVRTEDGTYRVEFDPEACSPSEAVIAAVSSATATDALELPPLSFVLDPDALDDLFDAATDTDAGRRGTTTFSYAGCDITASSDGMVVADPAR